MGITIWSVRNGTNDFQALEINQSGIVYRSNEGACEIPHEVNQIKNVIQWGLRPGCSVEVRGDGDSRTFVGGEATLAEVFRWAAAKTRMQIDFADGVNVGGPTHPIGAVWVSGENALGVIAHFRRKKYYAAEVTYRTRHLWGCDFDRWTPQEIREMVVCGEIRAIRVILPQMGESPSRITRHIFSNYGFAGPDAPLLEAMAPRFARRDGNHIAITARHPMKYKMTLKRADARAGGGLYWHLYERDERFPNTPVLE